MHIDFPPGDALAAYLAQLAVAAYQDREVLEPLLVSEGAINFSWFEKSGSAAFGCVLHGHPVIAFRGTSSLRYAVVDLLILPWGIPIRHFGFNLAWRRVRKQVLCWLDSLDTVKGIVFTGHSLGGAMAFLAAEELSDYTVDAVVTFGAPRPGMYGFAYKYNNKRCGRMSGGGHKSLYRVTRRYTNDTDVISRIPPPPLYKHVGGLVRSLGKDGKIEEEKPVSFLRRLCIQGNDLSLRVWNYRYELFLGGEEKDVDVRLTSIIFSFVKCFGPVAWLAGFFASFFGILFIPMAVYDFLCHSSRGYIRSFFFHGRYQSLALPWDFLDEE